MPGTDVLQVVPLSVLYSMFITSLERTPVAVAEGCSSLPSKGLVMSVPFGQINVMVAG